MYKSKKALKWVILSCLLGSLHQVYYRWACQIDYVAPWGLIYGQALFSCVLLGCGRAFHAAPSSSSLKNLPFLDRFFTYRAILALCGQICFIEAIRTMPLLIWTLSASMGMAITSIGSMIFFEKSVNVRRCVALMLAGLGMQWAHPMSLDAGISAYAMMATLCFSLSSLCTKALTFFHTPFHIVYDLSWRMALGSALLLAMYDPGALVFYGNFSYALLCLGLACVYCTLHLCMTKSYQESDLSVITLTKTLKVPMAALVDLSCYGRIASVHECVGSVLIMCAIMFHEWGENIEKSLKRLKRLTVHTKGLS